MPLRRVESPAERLKDPEYARAYGEETARASFAVCLATARIGAGLTQQELAERIGKSQPYVSKLESGEANPTLDTIGRILACVGKEVAFQAQPLGESRDEVPTQSPNVRSSLWDWAFAWQRSFGWLGRADASSLLSARSPLLLFTESADSVLSGTVAGSPSQVSSATQGGVTQ